MELAGQHYCIDCAEKQGITIEDFLKDEENMSESRIQKLEKDVTELTQTVNDFREVILSQQQVLDDLTKKNETQTALIEKLCQLAKIPF